MSKDTARAAAAPRPACVCRSLLSALDASDGRRMKRKRDQTADAIGIAAKRDLLERVLRDDPDPEHFEAWLLQRAAEASDGPFAGAAPAMARTIFDEWRLAHSMPEFAAWLERGAPSDDAPHRPRPAERQNGAAS